MHYEVQAEGLTQIGLFPTLLSPSCSALPPFSKQQWFPGFFLSARACYSGILNAMSLDFIQIGYDSLHPVHVRRHKTLAISLSCSWRIRGGEIRDPASEQSSRCASLWLEQGPSLCSARHLLPGDDMVSKNENWEDSHKALVPHKLLIHNVIIVLLIGQSWREECRGPEQRRIDINISNKAELWPQNTPDEVQVTRLYKNYSFYLGVSSLYWP